MGKTMLLQLFLIPELECDNVTNSNMYMVLAFYDRYPNSTSINHSLLKLIVFVSMLLKFSNKFVIVSKYKTLFNKKKSIKSI